MRGLLVSMLLLMAMAGCAVSERFEFTRLCMGVRTRVVVFAPDQRRANEAAQAAFARIGGLEAVMSDYRAASDLQRVNAAAGKDPVQVHPDLVAVLCDAARVSAASEGAFDVTAGPAVRAWREARRTGQLPSPIDVHQRLIDWRCVELDVDGCTVRLARPGMAIDLGGIGKGYAAHRAVERLRELGYPRCLVALAGDVYAGHAPPGRSGWRVQAGPEVLIVTNAGVSTSGDDQQFVQINGVQYAHIVDPRTGLGSTRRGQVTAVSGRGAWADAAATAGFLLGPAGAARLEAALPGTRLTFRPAPGEPAGHAEPRAESEATTGGGR